MKTNKPIKRDLTKVPKPTTHNPAADLLRDELENRGISASEASRAMHITRSRLSDIFAGRKGVSADTALRFQRYLGIPADYLISLQSDYDFRKAYHLKNKEIESEVQPLMAVN